MYLVDDFIVYRILVPSAVGRVNHHTIIVEIRHNQPTFADVLQDFYFHLRTICVAALQSCNYSKTLLPMNV